MAGGSPHVVVLDRYARDAEEPGQAAEGELAPSFRKLGNLSMGVARVLRPPRVRAPAPAGLESAPGGFSSTSSTPPPAGGSSLPSRRARMAFEGFRRRS